MAAVSPGRDGDEVVRTREKREAVIAIVNYGSGNIQAIANIYVTVVDKKSDGTLYNKLVKVIPNVNQTLGVPEDQYLAQGPLSRDNPSCP